MARAKDVTKAFLRNQPASYHAAAFGAIPRKEVSHVEPIRAEAILGERSRGDHEFSEQMVHSPKTREGTIRNRTHKALR